jgi:hypothetical protein
MKRVDARENGWAMDASYSVRSERKTGKGMPKKVNDTDDKQERREKDYCILRYRPLVS